MSSAQLIIFYRIEILPLHYEAIPAMAPHPYYAGPDRTGGWANVTSKESATFNVNVSNINMQKNAIILEQKYKSPPGNSPYSSGLPNRLEPIGGTAKGIPRNRSTSVPNGDDTTCPLMTPCCVGTSTTSCAER